MRKILENAQLIKDEIVTFRRTIHENPEFGQNLPKTTAYVMDKLRGFGYEPKEICESCVVATIQGKSKENISFKGWYGFIKYKRRKWLWI